MVASAVIVGVMIAVPAVRDPMLRSIGHALVSADPIGPADIIVVSPDSGGAGALEAADLVRSEIATRVAIFTDPPTTEDREYIRRGLPYENLGSRQLRQLNWLGVTDVLQISRTVVGTGGIGKVLPKWCDEHSIQSIVFVAARDHTRRLRRVLDRDMAGRPTRVAIRPARYSSFDPDRWWQSGSGIRTTVFEMQKLMLDMVLHPL